MDLCPANVMRTADRGFAYYTRYAPYRLLLDGCVSLWDAPSGLIAALDWRQTQAEFTTWGCPASEALRPADNHMVGATATASSGQNPPAATTTTDSGQDMPPAAADDGLSRGAKAGIGVGVSLAILLIVGIVGVMLWRKRRAKAKTGYENLAAEKDGKPITEKDGKEIIGELPGDRGTRLPVEMEA
ncbi:hypothetical protein H2199_003724 [Coniosporium tulheliwenetii]|uniref:Uncharacterized protein n=1 Tax=Coniosporium tulheliwenetii TaxID=3383036 RepID=A0ACC2ZAR1_9PEZI|nr:hypothetical protein H2199_003724 [Cladosporium sp. JES 115]